MSRDAPKVRHVDITSAPARLAAGLSSTPGGVTPPLAALLAELDMRVPAHIASLRSYSSPPGYHLEVPLQCRLVAAPRGRFVRIARSQVD